jgi:hypothetical protein
VQNEGMNGQWIGRYSGTNSGQLVIDLDDMDTHYEGRAFAYDDNPSLPGMCAFIKTPDKSSTFQLSLDLLPVDPRTGDPSSWDQLKTLFPQDVVSPRRAEVSISRNDYTLNVSWKTDIETTSLAELPKTRASEPTEYKPLPEITNWADFKTYVTGLEPRRYIFRGKKSCYGFAPGFTERAGPISGDF